MTQTMWSPDLDPTTAPYGVLMASWKEMTPEERSTEMKRRRAVADAKKKRGKRRGKSTRRKNNRREVREDGSSKKAEGIDHHVSYLYGKVETIIEYYANSNGIPVKALASGVASLLRH